MKKKTILSTILVLFLIVASFFLGMYFKEIKNSILEIFQNDQETPQVVQEETKNTPEYLISELGYTTFKNAVLRNMSFNVENKDYMRDITFTFVINNKSLQDGVKTVALISCEYTYNGTDMLYIGGTGIGRILEKAILLDESGDVTVGSDQFISQGVCDYDSSGYRRCVKNEENVITINNCVLGYSSNSNETHIGNIAWDIRNILNDKNYLNITFSNPEIVIEDTDILEKININKTININHDGNNQ